MPPLRTCTLAPYPPCAQVRMFLEEGPGCSRQILQDWGVLLPQQLHKWGETEQGLHAVIEKKRCVCVRACVCVCVCVCVRARVRVCCQPVSLSACQ